MVVPYIRDHGGLGLSGQKNHPKPASQYHRGALVQYWLEALKCLQYDPKRLLQNFLKIQ